MRKSIASCLLLLVALLATVCAQTPAPALSQPVDQCLQCQVYGQCALAYKNTPGQFCGKFLSSGVAFPCCCPTNSACAMPKDNKSCLCKELPPPKKSTPFWVWILVAIGVILIGVGIYFCFCRPSADDEVVFVESQQPVYVQQPQPVVYQQQPMYVQQTVVHDNDGGMGVGAGVAIGAAAGLVGGLALGAALDSGAHGGGGGGYGGGDDEGTFGGDF
ncbi:hypothetical protein SPRG_00027 [Saprolegnia parasitica CBS 223.65]|uniref:Uncharacterized protein n=1 Tax=Saprolegnia parasitica (strain CBS 223.65) TaxID=695850 RepID=A0A067D9A1_SAPPC|nr:hypothetical protein SPRG_00027 [Saprolegnia parasitica CBS 223.65]KDO35181.1 hypothetical protein SPRG_00027 [Saprolegnia parasitica CBS 223.65]|eukprot:XP_012193533.1 hypothetical protein SPRG_00027 [Saprolegnia parasitica CBS 223.65]